MYLKLLQYYFSLNKTKPMSPDNIRKRQVEKFRRLFEYARTHSPFYKKLYQDAGLNDLVIRDYSDILRVPIVDKAMLRDIPTEELMTRPMGDDLHVHYTSGSTGEPFKIVQTYYDEFTGHVRVFWMLKELGYYPWHSILMLTRYDKKASFDVEKNLSMIGKMRSTLKLFRRQIVSIYTPVEEMYSAMCEAKDSNILWSTPGILDIIADHMEKNNLTRPFKYIVLTSETLSETQRERFKRLFCGKIIGHYGTMEFPSIGFERGDGGNKHLIGEDCLLELIDTKDSAAENRSEAVITNLINSTMPFIRFNTHDWVEKLNRPDCPTKIIGPIIGRKDDNLKLKCGKTFAHHYAYEMFMDFAQCKQFKFVQYPNGNLALRLNIDSKADSEQVKQQALSRWQKRFLEEPLEIEFVETMPVSQKTGKFMNIEKLKE